MGLDYREFQATRESSGRGFDLMQTAGADRDPAYADLGKKAMRILNRFEYDTYKEAGLFLFYEESVKSFVAVKAEAGKCIDRRTNMQISLRMPKVRGTDGFGECLAYFYEWQTGKPAAPEMLTVREICQRYDISRGCLEHLACCWLKSVCALQAETIQLYSSKAEGACGAGFAGAMAQLCYALLPSGRVSKYSFAWNVSPEKCRGFRILVTEQAQKGRCLDLAEEGGCQVRGPEALMAKRIITEALDSTFGGRPFLDAFDWYFIKAAGYENMIWNFYYYLLDRQEEIPCDAESFFELKTGLDKQMERGVEKTKALYAALLQSVLWTPFTQEEGMRFLDIFLEFLLLPDTCTQELLNSFWFLLEKCAKKDNKEESNAAILYYLKQIRPFSEKLYFALLETGLGRDHDFLLELLEIRRLRSREAIKSWISGPNYKKLLKYPAVRSCLMEQLQSLFRQEASVDEIYKLALLGTSIDEEKCALFMEDYLKEGTEPYLSVGDAKGWSRYLLERKNFWRSARPFLIFLTEQYTEMAGLVEMPLDQESTKGLISVGTIFLEAGRKKEGRRPSGGKEPYAPKTERVQRTLLRRLCEAYETEASNKKSTENYYPVFRMLLKWETGNSEMVPEIQRAKRLLAKMAELEAEEQMTGNSLDSVLKYRIREEAEDKEKLYKYWLNQIRVQIRDTEEIRKLLGILQERANELLSRHVFEELKQLFEVIMELAKEERDIPLMEYILKTGELYEKLLELPALTVLFWKDISPDDYAVVRKYEKMLWENKSVFLRFPSETTEEKLYEIYRAFWEQGASETLLKEFHELQGRIKKEKTEQFLQQMLREWLALRRNRIPFSDVLDLLMTCWETKEELLTAVEGFEMDAEEREEILELIEEDSWNEENRKAHSRLPLSILTALSTAAGLWKKRKKRKREGEE